MIQRQQRHRDAVEACRRKRLIGAPVELGVAGEPVEACAAGSQRAGNRHAQHDVPLVTDSGVASRMAVSAACLQLVAKGGLIHNDIDDHGDQDRHKDAAVDLRIGEDLVKAHLGGRHAVEGGLVDIAGLSALGDIFQIAQIKNPCDQVRGDPVGHNARQHLVDVEEGLEHAGDRAPERAC